MSDKSLPQPEQRENGSVRGSAGEDKGAVVITGNGMPDGYEPPSGALPGPATPGPAGDESASSGNDN